MKKIVLAAVALCIWLSMGMGVSATEPEPARPTIVVSSAWGDPGDTVEVTVRMQNNPGIVSTKVKVGYDASVVELVEYKAGDFDNGGYSWSPAENNPFIVNWCLATQPNSTETLLATLTFKIKENALPGRYSMSLYYDNEGDIYNSDWDTVYFGAQVGEIVVAGDTLPPEGQPTTPTGGSPDHGEQPPAQEDGTVTLPQEGWSEGQPTAARPQGQIINETVKDWTMIVGGVVALVLVVVATVTVWFIVKKRSQ